MTGRAPGVARTRRAIATTEHTATGGNLLTRENVMKQAASAVVAGPFCCRLRGKNATKPALRKKSLP